jgi:hypothetical protein
MISPKGNGRSKCCAAATAGPARSTSVIIEKNVMVVKMDMIQFCVVFGSCDQPTLG